jgi:hypothetical protein
MGTTLTGTTPQDTYDSLIKVTDNGPLSGTAKYLSDGLGNDSALALSTAGVGIGTDAPTSKLHIYNGEATIGSGTDGVKLSYSGGNSSGIIDTAFSDNNLEFRTNGNTKMWIANAGNVGIGTDAPVSKLDVAAAATGNVTALTLSGGDFNTGSCALGFQNKGISGWTTAQIKAVNYPSSYAADLAFVTNNGTLPSDVTEKGRFTYNGYLRMASGTGGIQFNGDTAAANALDDYEEGTWTMGVSFGGASVGVTYGVNTGTYVKIGRQVTVNGYLLLANKGSSTGSALITGLPFTIANSGSNYSAPSFRLNEISFANQYQAYGPYNTTTIVLDELTEAGVLSNISDANFANNSEVILSFTYFV